MHLNKSTPITGVKPYQVIWCDTTKEAKELAEHIQSKNPALDYDWTYDEGDNMKFFGILIGAVLYPVVACPRNEVFCFKG